MKPTNSSEELVIKSIKPIKENLSLIILLPAIFGGLWQIIELSSISMTYVRFFSITQLVADGFLVILASLPWLINFIVFQGIYLQTKEHTKKDSKSSIGMKILIFAWTLILFYVTYFFISNSGSTATDYFINTVFISLNIFSLVIFDVLPSYNAFIEKVFYDKARIVKFVFFFSFICVLFSYFHKMFYIPNNLENIQYIPAGNVRYFNDKYIFIEYKQKDNNSSTIQVIPFEQLFPKHQSRADFKN